MTQDSYIQYVSYVKMFGDLTLFDATRMLEDIRLKSNYEVEPAKIRLAHLRARTLHQFVMLKRRTADANVRMPPDSLVNDMNDIEICEFFKSNFTLSAAAIKQRIKQRREIEKLTNGVTI